VTLALYDFNTDLNAVAFDANVNAGTFTGGPGLNASQTGGDLFANEAAGIINNTGAAGLAVAIADDSYFSVTISTIGSFVLDIDNIVLDVSRNTNGPQAFAIRSSLDDFADNLFDTGVNSVGTTDTDFDLFAENVDFSGLDNLSSLELRIYAYDRIRTNNASSSFNVDNFLVEGSVTAIPAASAVIQEEVLGNAAEEVFMAINSTISMETTEELNNAFTETAINIFDQEISNNLQNVKAAFDGLGSLSFGLFVLGQEAGEELFFSDENVLESFLQSIIDPNSNIITGFNLISDNIDEVAVTENFIANAVNSDDVGDLSNFLQTAIDNYNAENSDNLLSAQFDDLTVADVVAVFDSQGVTAALINDASISQDEIESSLDLNVSETFFFENIDMVTNDNIADIRTNGDLSTNEADALEVSLVNNNRLDANGNLRSGLVPLATEESSLIDASMAQGVLAGGNLQISLLDLVANGAHHRNLFSRFRDENHLEWATVDFETQDVAGSETDTIFIEAGLGYKFASETLAAGVSFGYSNFSHAFDTNNGSAEFDTDGIVLSGEVNKSFFSDKLVLSSLLSFGVSEGDFSRNATVNGTTGNGFVIDRTAGFSVTTDSGTSALTFNENPVNILTAGAVTENLSADFSTQVANLRLRADFEVYRNDYIAITPRFAYSLANTSVSELEEEGGDLPNTFDSHDIQRSQIRLGVDIDWFINDKYEVRFLAETSESTVDEYGLTVRSSFANLAPISVVIPETTVAFQRVGVELGIHLDNDLFTQFFLSQSTGDIEATLFSVNFSRRY